MSLNSRLLTFREFGPLTGWLRPSAYRVGPSRRYRVPEAPRSPTIGLLLTPLRLWTSKMPRIGASEVPPSSTANADPVMAMLAPTTNATKAARRDLLRHLR